MVWRAAYATRAPPAAMRMVRYVSEPARIVLAAALRPCGRRGYRLDTGWIRTGCGLDAAGRKH
ncbi:hypothetical protein CT19431_MP60001 [Cupriavidus taiwanensis]|nr:hypothetical protein CT19431_MP60001 [Cupriavidus taiwanensis]